MSVIKFSHDYPKLWHQTSAVLIDVWLIKKEAFPLAQELIDYDTRTSKGKFYPLPKNDYLQLFFVGNKGIPFCTIRRRTPEKEEYYNSKIKERFEIKLIKGVEK